MNIAMNVTMADETRAELEARLRMEAACAGFSIRKLPEGTVRFMSKKAGDWVIVEPQYPTLNAQAKRITGAEVLTDHGWVAL